MPEEKKNVYITLHKSFCKEVEYIDKETGEERTFNSVTLPKGTVIEGQDVSYFQFSPMFVNEAKYRGENFRDIPLLANQEIWLQKSVLDTQGKPVIGEDGKRVRETVKVTPSQLRESIETQRREYFDARNQERDGRSLNERASQAREGSNALADHDIPFEQRSR